MSEHWDNTICYANYLLIAMFVQLCVKHWNDKKGGAGMTPSFFLDFGTWMTP
ncbi:MAG: hypothetical protein ACR5K3_02255 [Wolbachia sp.]